MRGKGPLQSMQRLLWFCVEIAPKQMIYLWLLQNKWWRHGNLTNRLAESIFQLLVCLSVGNRSRLSGRYFVCLRPILLGFNFTEIALFDAISLASSEWNKVMERFRPIATLICFFEDFPRNYHGHFCVESRQDTCCGHVHRQGTRYISTFRKLGIAVWLLYNGFYKIDWWALRHLGHESMDAAIKLIERGGYMKTPFAPSHQGPLVHIAFPPSQSPSYISERSLLTGHRCR